MGTLFKKYDFSKRGFPKLEDTEFLLNLSVIDQKYAVCSFVASIKLCLLHHQPPPPKRNKPNSKTKIKD